MQVIIDITSRSIRSNPCTVIRPHWIGGVHGCGCSCREIVISRHTITDTYFEVIEKTDVTQKCLIGYTPSTWYCPKCSPTMILSEFWRALVANTSCKHIAVFIAIIRPAKEWNKTFTGIFVGRHCRLSVGKPATCPHIPSPYSIHRKIVVSHIKVFRVIFPITISGYRTNRMVVCKNTHEIDGRFKRDIDCFAICMKSSSFITSI